MLLTEESFTMSLKSLVINVEKLFRVCFFPVVKWSVHINFVIISTVIKKKEVMIDSQAFFLVWIVLQFL